ncbi:MAG: C39 family peptidase [Myxococcota bacterium]
MSLASRLASHLGAPRLSLAVAFHAHRKHPGRADAAARYVFAVAERRGPLWLLDNARSLQATTDGTPRDRALLVLAEAQALSVHRDRQAAETAIQRARGIDPDLPWVDVNEGYLALEFGDLKCAERLAQSVLEREPHYRSAIDLHATLLSRKHGPAAALELIEPHEARCQSLFLTHRNFQYAFALERWERCSALIERIHQFSPLAEEAMVDQRRKMELQVCYHRRQFAQVIDLGRQTKSEHWKQVAEKLAETNQSPPSLVPDQPLAVPYVPQKHDTCGPATLTSIARFFGRAVEHDAVVDAICFGGTAGHKERRWATDQGFRVTEFDVDRESLKSLLAAGVPFTLTTSGADMGHLQAVVGYDPLRDVVYTRDPSVPYLSQLEFGALMKFEPSTGPRGMTLIPTDSPLLPVESTLPGRQVRDLAYAFDTAIDEGREVDAATHLSKMEELDEDHPLVLDCRLVLSAMQHDRETHLKSVRSLFQRFPEVPRFRRAYAASLRDELQFEERQRELLQFEDDPDPAIASMVTQGRLLHAERRSEVRRTLLRLTRVGQVHPEVYAQLATLAQLDGEQERAFELRRFAASTGVRNEHYAFRFFLDAVRLGRAGEALAFLHERLSAAGDRSSGPAQTLYDAYSLLGRGDEGLAVLTTLAESRADDPFLMMSIARAYLAAGEVERAQALVERVDEERLLGTRLLLEGQIADALGDARAGAKRFSEAVQHAPFRPDVVQAYVVSLADELGLDAAVAFLENVVEQRPYDRGLFELMCIRLRASPEEALQKLLPHLATQPDHIWARREVAFIHCARGRPEDALHQIEQSFVWWPDDPAGLAVKARALLQLGRRSEARDAAMRALALNVDVPDVWPQLRLVATSTDDMVTLVEEAANQIEKQGTDGSALVLLSELLGGRATPRVEPRIEQLHQRFSALPNAWLLKARYLVDANQFGRAAACLDETTRRFPRTPAIFEEIAFLAQQQVDPERELAALQTVRRFRPYDPQVITAYAHALHRHNRHDEAVRGLRESCEQFPRNGLLRASLAELLWARDQQEEAFDELLTALADLSAGDFRWETAREWATVLGASERVQTVAQAIVDANPESAVRHSDLAACLTGKAQIAALESAVEVAPSDAGLKDQLICAWVAEGDFTTAESLCLPEAWEHDVPVVIQGRHAWVMAARGDMRPAIQRMQMILSENPFYVWGWSQLTGWHQAMSDVEGFRRASAQWMEVAPYDLGALGARLEALVATPTDPELVVVLDRMLAADPGHSGAASVRFDLLAGSRNQGAIQEFLERVGPHQPKGGKGLLEARAAVVRGHYEDAVRAVASVLREPLNEYDMRVLARQLAEVSADLFSDVLEAAMVGDDVPSPRAVAGAWLSLWPALGVRLIRRLVDHGHELNNGGQWALSFVLEEGWLAGGAPRREVERLVEHHAESFGRSTVLWGAAGFVLTSSGKYARAWAVLRDYGERPDATPWMLTNVLFSATARAPDHELTRAAEVALRLPPDHTRGQVECWAALGFALAGRVEEATKLLSFAIPDDPLSISMVLFGRALVTAEQCREGTAIETMRKVGSQLADALAWAGEYDTRAHIYVRVLRRLRARLSFTRYALVRIYAFAAGLGRDVGIVAKIPGGQPVLPAPELRT